MFLLALVVIVAALLLVFGFEMFLVLGVPALMTKQFFFGSLPDPVVVQKIVGGINHSTLLAIPFFILAAELMGEGQIARRLTGLVQALVGHRRGGIGYTVIGGSMAFGSVSGSAPATVAAMGRMVYPEMRANGFSEKFSLGLIASSAETALLIPPSIIMIVYGVAANVSISKLFLAGVIPGLMLAALFMGYIIVWALFNKDKVPAPDARLSFVQKLYASRHLIPVVSLIVVVLGAIYSGIATATEAAALGVAGSLILAKIEGSLNWERFKEGLVAACRVYCMIGLILAGAAFLTLAMGFIGLPRHLAEFIGALHLSPFALMLLLIVFFIVLGCFLDGISMVVLTIAVLLPTVEAAGFDLVWFGIFIVLVVEMAQITPPVGFNLFVLQGMTRREVTWIARTALPLFALMIVAVVMTYFVPDVVLWLPRQMQG